LSASTKREKAEPSFRPFTRKYLGSKRVLRDWIADSICARAGVPGSFVDGFFGTGAVSAAMASRGAARIIAVDTLRSNCVILRGFCARSSRIPRLMEELNALPGSGGYITESYAGTYFTEENCRRMDAVRERIAELRSLGAITVGEHDILLASFLLAADRVANTIGQYDAFLKHIGGAAMVDGRHLVDQRVQTPFVLRHLEPLGKAGVAGSDSIDVIEGDMLELAAGLPVEVAYYDPPYNGRQYCDNYHVLENFARWEKPPLFGATRKFDRTSLKSPFSRRSSVAQALSLLLERTRARHVFLSYSSEGILSADQILATLSLWGTPSASEMAYPVFGNGAGVSARRSVIEYLFHVEIEGAA
jgi:adenine-specific DNA-methyltransferase